MQLVLLSRDLMLASRIDGVAKQNGFQVIQAPDQANAIAAVAKKDCQMLFVDLQCPGIEIATLVGEVKSNSNDKIRIIACGPHVHEKRLDAAREAGCDLVVTKGQFDREANAILNYVD